MFNPFETRTLFEINGDWLMVHQEFTFFILSFFSVHLQGLTPRMTIKKDSLRNNISMLFIVDFQSIDSIECLIIEADSYDSAYESAVNELKMLGFPKRNILNMEEF